MAATTGSEQERLLRRSERRPVVVDATRRAPRVLVLLFLTLAGAVYLRSTWRIYRASQLMAVQSRASMEAAVRLQPLNAEYEHRLGAYDLMVEQDATAAVPHLRRATELAPHVARYWLTLGNAYNVVGDSDSRRHALITAANADPSNAEINWNVAVGFLAEGEVQSSLPYFRRAFAMDRHTIGSGASLLLRASESVATVVSLLPPDAASRLNVLNTLVDQDNLPAAAAVWKELLASGYSFSARAALPYVNALIRAGDAGTALTAWEQLVAAQPELRPFQQEHNLVFNPDFEHAILNGGFDWSYQPSAGVSVDLENSETGRALRINFEGDPVADCGISQVLALQPNTTYELGAMQKSESLLGANGPRFQVRNLKTHAVLFTGKEFRGTFAWQESREVFRTGSETQLAEIRLVRSPANTRIRGTIWLDHISLRAVRGE